MQTIDETLSDITGSKLTDLELARRALTISNDNNRIVTEIVLVENRRLVEPLLAARSQNSKEITKLIEESESRCESEKEKKVLAEVKRTRKPYLESCQRAIHLLIDEGKHDEAETVMVNETLPALHTYHAAWEKFVEFQQEELDAAVKQAQVNYGGARRLASLLIGLAVILAIMIALFATRGAAHEIAARISAEKEVSKLNAGLEERVKERTHELNDAIKRLDLQAAALEAAANGIVITDRQGSILWMNKAFTTLTGYSQEELLGKNPRILASGKQTESFYATLWLTISSGKVWQGEIVNRRKDGTTYTEEMTITPVTQQRDNVTDTYFIAIKQDITGRKQFEETVLFKTALLEAQAETTIDGILAVDESEHIILANKQFGLHFDIPDALLRTRDDQIVRNHVVAKMEAPDVFLKKVKYLYGHRDEKSRDEIRLTNGKVFDRYSAPLIDSQGSYRGRIWYFRDITDRIQSEERVAIPGILRRPYGTTQSDAAARSPGKGAGWRTSAQTESRASIPGSG